MEIVFTPGIIECQQLFQITKSHILKAVEDPNQKQAIDVNGLRLEFYTNEEEAGYTILVCAHKENEKLLLDSTFKVFPTLITETHALEPLELLRQLALKFGLVMHFGPEATRFLVHRVRPMPAGSNQTPLIGVSNPGNHFPLQRFFLKIDQANGMNLINCSLAYCIDLNTYIAWLMDEQENRAGSPIVEEAELSNREFARQCRIMLEEQLFSLDWLLDERNKNHPAHYQWKLCENIINGTPLGFERQDENVAKVGRILLDMVVLQELLIRDTNQRKHIVINKLIDDENALNNVLARLRDPQTYDDCLLELV
ncbi:MAG: hypothetical protein ACXV7G_14115, partial [Halobacteriota archaeon]